VDWESGAEKGKKYGIINCDSLHSFVRTYTRDIISKKWLLVLHFVSLNFLVSLIHHHGVRRPLKTEEKSRLLLLPG